MADSHLSQPTTVLLIEPAGDLAATLHDELLRSLPSCVDIGVARSLREAMHHLSAHPVDVALMDLTLPDYKGADAVRALRLTAPTCALIALSAGDDERPLLEALRAGAHEVLCTLSLAPRDLRLAVERAVIRAHPPAAPSAPAARPQPPLTLGAGRAIHDLNNTLTSINGFADVLLARLPADDPARGPVEHIRAAGLRAAALARSLSTPADGCAAPLARPACDAATPPRDPAVFAL
jgi:DNA-binding response OmpR family regulator